MRKRKKITSLLVAITFLVIVSYLLQKRIIYIDTQQVKEFIHSFGLLGPIVFMILNAVSIVFAPVTALPFWAASLALYGFWQTLFYILISFNVGAVINFWIARKWGRPIVLKLVGKKGINEVDKITEVVGLHTLLFVRLIGGASSDYVAYAAGLTNMKFRPYFLITFLATPPSMILNVYVIYGALSLKPIFIIFGLIGYTLSVVLPLWVYHHQRKKLNSQ